MKHVFIINPKSGKDDKKEGLLNQLKKYKDKLDYQIYITKSSKDATRYVDEYCKQYKEDVTFYACGGDGTLNEVVSGAIGHNNAIVSIYPCGSGNDFVKIYGGKEKFSNIYKKRDAPKSAPLKTLRLTSLFSSRNVIFFCRLYLFRFCLPNISI